MSFYRGALTEYLRVVGDESVKIDSTGGLAKGLTTPARLNIQLTNVVSLKPSINVIVASPRFNPDDFVSAHQCQILRSRQRAVCGLINKLAGEAFRAFLLEELYVGSSYQIRSSRIPEYTVMRMRVPRVPYQRCHWECLISTSFCN